MALQGTLDTFALPEVLRLLASAAKTGRLRVDGDRGSGELWLDQGAVCAQAVGGAGVNGGADVPPLVEAVFDLLRNTEGSFEFSEGEVAPSNNGHGSAAGDPTEIDDVLAEATERLARWREIQAVVPSAAAGIALVAEQDEAVTVTPDQWGLLVAVGTGTTVEALGEAMAWGEFRAAGEVRDLVDAGLVAITGPGNEAEVADSPVSADELSAPVELSGADDAMVEALPQAEVRDDPDMVVEAELATHPDHGERRRPGNVDVALDDPLGAGPDDHHYLTAEGPLTEIDPLPEPLPASEPTEAAEGDPFAHPPGAAGNETDSGRAPWPPTSSAGAGGAGADPVAGNAASSSPDESPAPGETPDTDEATKFADHLAGLSPEAARAVVAAAGSGQDEDVEREPTNRSSLARFIQGR